MWEKGSYWKHERTNLNQKWAALPICVTWHWTFKGKTQNLFQLLCLPIWEENSNPLRLLSSWYYWKADPNLTARQWVSSFSFQNSIAAPRIIWHSFAVTHFLKTALSMHNRAGTLPRSLCEHSGQRELQWGQHCWGRGQGTGAHKPQGCQMCRFVSRTGAWSGRTAEVSAPAMSHTTPSTHKVCSQSLLCTAELCCSRFSQLCLTGYCISSTLPPHLVSHKAYHFTFPPMVNYNRNSKFYDSVTCKTCF